MHTKLTDIYEIRPGQQILEMDADQKAQLLDAATSVSGGKKRGLIITFDLSSSFRVTNNRLYTAAGQQAGVSTWTKPYPKPILRNHDQKSDPIGRIISVEWVGNDQEAMKFFSDTADFMEFKRAMDSGNPQKIYKEMLKRSLLTNSSWPGLGKLVAKARISDADAIEKFLDGRYLTFSAGSHTDKYCCGLCGSDWATGDVCEHLPGSIDDEGRPAIMVTGTFMGREASVVTTPGNDLSQLTSMEFGDALEVTDSMRESVKIDRRHITFTDAVVETEDLSDAQDGANLELEDFQQPPEALPLMLDMLGTLLGQYLLYYNAHWRSSGNPYYGDHLLFERLYGDIVCELDTMAEKIMGYNGDAIDIVEINRIATSKLQKWTTSGDFVAQGLASEADMQSTFKLYYDELKEMGAMPMGLDDFLMAVASTHDSHEYLLQQRASASPNRQAMDNQTMDQPTMDQQDEQLGNPEAALEDESSESQAPEGSETQEVNDDSQTETDSQEEVEDEGSQEAETDIDISDADVDWGLLDLALQAEIILLAREDEEYADAELSSEAREKLSDKDFCGPDRSFPVHDCAHVTAARRLIGRAKLSEDQKKSVLACVDRKAKALGCDSEQDSAPCACDSLQVKIDTLMSDYRASLELATKLQGEVDSLKEKLAALDTASEPSHDDGKNVPSVENIKPVEDESVSSSQSLNDSVKELGDYEKKIVSRYKELRDTKGDRAANHFLTGKIARGHLPRTFDITPHIQENE
jgi:DNA-binding ferritin-like protein